MRMLLLACFLMGVTAVFVWIFVAIAKHRRTAVDSGCFHSNARVEMAWAVVPCLMVMAACAPAVTMIIAASLLHPPAHWAARPPTGLDSGAKSCAQELGPRRACTTLK